MVLRSKKFSHNIDPQAKKLYQEAIFEWENEVKEKEKKKESTKAYLQATENLFDGAERIDVRGLSDDEKKSRAENEKIKGNEALKSGVISDT